MSRTLRIYDVWCPDCEEEQTAVLIDGHWFCSECDEELYPEEASIAEARRDAGLPVEEANSRISIGDWCACPFCHAAVEHHPDSNYVNDHVVVRHNQDCWFHNSDHLFHAIHIDQRSKWNFRW